MRLISLLALSFLVPSFANATVMINEVAWMGTTVSANAEWMELFNNSNSPVDITGWKLVAESGSPSITLAGSISANGYFLLERTSDASVPNVTANQIYTGALSNSGTTLALTNFAGIVVDSVDGGANWMNIGGDNASKNTAQRTNNGWETASPTPGARNYGVPITSSEESETITSTATTTNVTANESYPQNTTPPEYIPIPTLRIITGKDRIVSAGAGTAFTASVYDSKGNKREDALVSWSFGDGMKRTGAGVFHSFYYPGEYVVVVHAITSDGGEVMEQRIITAKDASIKIAIMSNQGISVTNNSQRTLDLSLWRLSMGGKEFKIPSNTQILAGRTIIFAPQVIQLPIADTVALLYPSGEVATMYPPVQKIQPPTQMVQPSVSQTSFSGVQAVEPIISKVTNTKSYDEAVIAPSAISATGTVEGAALPDLSETAQSKEGGLFRSSWFLGLLGIIALAGSSLAFL